MANNSERIADQIAGVIMGFVLAGLACGVMHWLWPEMALPVFIIFLVSWGVSSVDTEIAEREARVRTSRFGWKYMKPSDVKSAHPRTCTWGDAALLVSGINIGLFVGALVGLLWPSARWPAAFIAFAAWTATIVVAIVNAWRDWSDF